MIYVLIEADEGFTGSVWIAESIEGVLSEATAEYSRLVDRRISQEVKEQDTIYFSAVLAGLRNMIMANEWTPGRYNLTLDTPHGGQWTLIVEEMK